MPPYESLPYRPCAGMMVLNRAGLVFVGRRIERPRAHRRHPCLADAAGRHRRERRPVQGGAARALRGNQYPLGGEARRDRRMARLRHPARHRRRRPGAANIAGRSRNGTRCASPATTARSTSSTPAAGTSRNSSPGAGWRWPNCPTWWCRSSGRPTSGWSKEFAKIRVALESDLMHRRAGQMPVDGLEVIEPRDQFVELGAGLASSRCGSPSRRCGSRSWRGRCPRPPRPRRRAR